MPRPPGPRAAPSELTSLAARFQFPDNPADNFPMAILDATRLRHPAPLVEALAGSHRHRGLGATVTRLASLVIALGIAVAFTVAAAAFGLAALASRLR